MVKLQRIVRKQRPGIMISQDKSPLFRLPPELREIISLYSLSDIPASPHLHVYGNESFEHCLYESHRSRPQRPNAVSLLRTCIAVYNETIDIVYKGTVFEIVLLAGTARPWINLQHRPRVWRHGRPIENLPFRCMSNVTLTVQPGWTPALKDHLNRVANFLELFEYGKHCEKLAINSNFDTSTNRETVAAPVVLAFMPLATKKLTNTENVSIALPFPTRPDQSPHYIAAVTSFIEALHTPMENLLESYSMDPASTCKRRGSHSRHDWLLRLRAMNTPPTTARERRLMILKDYAALAAVVVLSPIVLPTFFLFHGDRKHAKGESWRVLGL